MADTDGWADALDDEEAEEEVEEEVEKAEPVQLSEKEANMLVQQGLIMQQLLHSEKFVTFINMNYDLVRDEESKMMYVVEVPDDVAAERAMSIMKKNAQSAPQLVTASAAEAKKLLNDPNFLRNAKNAQKKR